MKGLKGGYNEEGHTAVVEELAKLFKMDKAKMTDYSTRIFKKFSEISKNGDLKIDDLFDDNNLSSILKEL